MTGQQRWNYGDWMLKAMAEAKRKQKRPPRKPDPNDIFNYGISLKNDSFIGYNRNTGKKLFEAESYDEARRVLEEHYSSDI